MKDNNILLANFIGMQKTNIGWYDAEEILLKVEKDNTFDILKFNTDWNWLMQVVEKIKSLGNYGFTIYRKSVNINGLPFELASTRGITKIEAVYNACVTFIEWWNRKDEV